MDPLNITENPDGTLTFNGDLADPVLCSSELWATLEASDHATVDARPPGDQGQPAATYLSVSTDRYHLTYAVKAERPDGYVLELGSYSEV